MYSYSSVKGWKISDKTLASIVRICTPAAADPCLSQRKQRRSVRLSAVDLICTVDVRSAVESCIRVCTRQHAFTRRRSTRRLRRRRLPSCCYRSRSCMAGRPAGRRRFLSFLLSLARLADQRLRSSSFPPAPRPFLYGFRLYYLPIGRKQRCFSYDKTRQCCLTNQTITNMLALI